MQPCTSFLIEADGSGTMSTIQTLARLRRDRHRRRDLRRRLYAVLSHIPHNRMCMTSRAVFGFRVADNPGPDGKAIPNAEATQKLYERYPAAVRQWITRHGGMSTRMIFLRGGQLQARYRSCPADIEGARSQARQTRASGCGFPGDAKEIARPFLLKTFCPISTPSIDDAWPLFHCAGDTLLHLIQHIRRVPLPIDDLGNDPQWRTGSI